MEVRSSALVAGSTLAHSVPLPLLRVEVGDLRATVGASNNPWRGKGSASLGRFKVGLCF